MTRENVVVRAHLSGMWIGTLVKSTKRSVVLRARRLRSWRGALDASALALSGPGEGTVASGMTDVTLLASDCIEIHIASFAAMEALEKVPVAQ